MLNKTKQSLILDKTTAHYLPQFHAKSLRSAIDLRKQSHGTEIIAFRIAKLSTLKSARSLSAQTGRQSLHFPASRIRALSRIFTMHMNPFSLPSDYPRIKRVKSFQELMTTPFANGVNALCWERTLEGDFGEVVNTLKIEDGIVSLDEAQLLARPVSAAGRIAIEHMLKDHRLLQDHALDPVLNCIRSYPREENPGIVPTDVYSFHADSATIETDTCLCTYYGAPSEGLRNEEAQRRVDIPEIQSRLRNSFVGNDDEFREYLRENCYDLHYAALPFTKPFSFGLGNLWRIAVDYPGCPVPPCIHRAPENIAGSSPRLLLIS